MTQTAVRAPAEVARPAGLRQLPGLDGLRAIAVVAVIVYHLDPSVLPGGYLGVDIFFVISGYLITSLLLAEFRTRRSVSLKHFWARRGRRLLPAVVVLMAAVTLLAALFDRAALAHMQGDVPASLLYVLNWRLVLQHDSYLASLGRPPLLLHLWSLSVEEQFYLLWPLALLGLRRRMRPQQVALVAVTGAAASAVLMAVLFSPGSDPSGVYFATPTDAHGFLMGAALAAAVPPWGMARSVAPAARRVLERAGLASLAVVLVGLVMFGFYSPVTYRGGMLLIDVATAVLIATVAHPATRLGPVLARQPLRWIGRRSYSLYLWHWPIFEMVTSGGLLGLTLRTGLTAAAAELSYRWVEQPWRTGSAQARLRILLASGRGNRVRYAMAATIAALVAVLATAPAGGTPTILLEGSTPAARDTPLQASATTGAPALAPLSPPGSGTSTPDTTASNPRAHTVARSSTPSSAPASPNGPYLPVLALGDSVLLAASPDLQSRYGSQITIDAAVGRQVAAGIARLAQYRSSGALSRYRAVLIDLGTNGAFQPWQFDQMAEILAGVPRVVVYDVHADRPWVAASNATISAGVASHPTDMRLADWNRFASQPGLLYSDGVHPNTAGSRIYSGLLAPLIGTGPGPAAPATTTTTPTTSAPTTTVAAQPTTTTPPPSTTTPTTAAPAPTTTTTQPAITTTTTQPQIIHPGG